jgi:hypothetical protein
MLGIVLLADLYDDELPGLQLADLHHPNVPQRLVRELRHLPQRFLRKLRECERGNCPNGQCTTRYRGPADSLSRPDSPRYERSDYGRDRSDYGRIDSATYRPSYLGDRPIYSADRPSYRDQRDEPVSRRSLRSERRPSDRDRDLDSPFYN